MMLLFALIIAQTTAADDLYPAPAMLQQAQVTLDAARSMFSDFHQVYPFTWTAAFEGPCPEVLKTSDNGDDWPGLPCRGEIFEPDPSRPPVPAALWTA